MLKKEKIKEDIIEEAKSIHHEFSGPTTYQVYKYEMRI